MNLHPAMPVPPARLTDGGITIRPWEPGDEPALFDAARESIATVGQWLPWLSDRYDLADSASWISSSVEAWRAGQEYRFAVFGGQGGQQLLGGVGLNQLNRVHRLANLGYWVRASATGRGVATSAARLAARFAVTDLGFARVEILAAENNLASRKVAEKLGARLEGVLRDRLWHGERVFSASLYALVRDDLHVATRR